LANSVEKNIESCGDLLGHWVRTELLT